MSNSVLGTLDVPGYVNKPFTNQFSTHTLQQHQPVPTPAVPSATLPSQYGFSSTQPLAQQYIQQPQHTETSNFLSKQSSIVICVGFLIIAAVVVYLYKYKNKESSDNMQSLMVPIRQSHNHYNDTFTPPAPPLLKMEHGTNQDYTETHQTFTDNTKTNNNQDYVSVNDI